MTDERGLFFGYWTVPSPPHRFHRMTDEAGLDIMHAVIEANKALQLMMDGPAPWEKCCTVRVVPG